MNVEDFRLDDNGKRELNKASCQAFGIGLMIMAVAYIIILVGYLSGSKEEGATIPQKTIKANVEEEEGARKAMMALYKCYGEVQNQLTKNQKTEYQNIISAMKGEFGQGCYGRARRIAERNIKKLKQYKKK